MLMLYTNGSVPLSVVSIVLGSGRDSKGRSWEHRLTPAMAARWLFAVDYAYRKWGHRMQIKAGANAYRDLAWQEIARTDACADGNCNGASVPKYSSHGGNWSGRDCLAIDVDPGWDANGRQIISWAQVWEACTAAGFACGLITPQISGRPDGEPWHVIDFAAFGPVPAGLSLTQGADGVWRLNQSEEPTDPPKEEEDMSYSIVPTGSAAGSPIFLVSLVTGARVHIASPYHLSLLQRLKKNDNSDNMLAAEVDICRAYLTGINPPANMTVDVDALAAALAPLEQGADAATIQAAVDKAIADFVKKLGS